jgi:uncharacterized surface protein with fasciclin (FAS1) repeats
MTSKIIALVGAMVGVSLAGAVGFTAPARSQPAVTDHIRPLLSPAIAERPARPRGTSGHRPRIGPATYEQRALSARCRFLPRRGPDSQAALATTPVATAIRLVPGLSELAHAIQLAGLTRMLNAARTLTVFAPDDASFHYLGAGNLAALLSTGPDLVRVLKFHLVAGRLTPAQLAKRHVLTTVAGTKLNLVLSGNSLSVNNATVTCGAVQTSNATVYVVSRVIVPAS